MTIAEGDTRVINLVTSGRWPGLFLEASERKLTHPDKPFSKCFWKYTRCNLKNTVNV